MKYFYGIVYCILFLTGGASAQEVLFRKLTSNHGLSHNTVYAISQDDKGLMWFATREGLNRYDSYQIKNYYVKDLGPGGSSNKINSLLCDLSYIYVGTDNGLYVYDQKTDNLTKNSIFQERIPVLFLLKDAGSVLAGTSAGLYKITKTGYELISAKNVPAKAMGVLSKNRFLVNIGNKLQIIDGKGNVFRTFDSTALSVLSISDFNVFNIYRDEKGLLWLCTNYGLFYYNIQTQRFFRLNFSHLENQETNTVRSVVNNGKDLLYIGTEDGLYIYHLKTGVSENYQQSFSNDPKKLNDKAIYSSFAAKDGSLWFGTYFGGVNYIPANTYGFNSIIANDNGKGLSGKAISQIVEDSQRNIWIGTEDGGITIYNSEKDSYSYINKKSWPFYLNISNVHAIHDDGYGNVWIGTFLGGLHQFDLKKRTTTVYTSKAGNKDSLSNDYVYAIYRDSRGKLWIGTQNGLNVFDYKLKNFKLFKPELLGSKFIYDITEDKNGDLWFCTRFDGIYRYNPSKEHIVHYSVAGTNSALTSNEIISVYQDSKQQLWFGTLNGGVCVYNIEKNDFQSFTINDGLPNNNIYGILEDDKGCIWMTTNRGISKYDPRSNHFTNYDNKYGLPSNQFNFKSYLKSSDETLYFGSINGLCFFRPDEIASNQPLVPLVFTDFKLFNKSVIPSGTAVLKNQIDYTDEIELSYNQNVFTIDYAAINYANPGSTNYAYYLKGFEDKWNLVGTRKSASYTNLSPGNYVFHIKATQANGAIHSNERTIRIKVNPPFYLTKAAYIFYVLFVLGLIWIYTRFVKFLHQKKLEVQIERIEKEKIKELTQNRLNFFTFISHEFKTPLTLILVSIDKFITERGVDFKKNTELSTIKNNASILFKLIQQLIEFRKIETNHHSVNLALADIVDFLKTSTFYFEAITRNKDITLEFHSEKVELQCYFDKDKVEKILFNIVSNAVKNTDTGKVDVYVSFKNEEKDTGQVEIKVQDTGKGMTDKQLKNVFSPFYKPSESVEGNGIGLALVHSLVQYLNGEIKISSKQGKGTVLQIFLPIILNPDAKSFEKQAPEQKELPARAISKEVSRIGEDTVSEKKYTLLIVEDNRELLTFLSNHFSKNYNISTASNGISALKKISKTPPDIIISDVKMPGMDGLELCRSIKANPKFNYIPVILLSDSNTENIKIDGLDIGADAYLSKPFNLKEFELLVSNMIKSRVKLREYVINISEFAIDNLPDNNRAQEFLTKLTETLEKRFSDSSTTIEDIAKDLSMSRTSLHLNLKKILNKNASELLNEYRLKRATVMLENDMPVNEVAFYCGYSDPNYFSRVFKRKYKETPVEYKRTISENKIPVDSP